MALSRRINEYLQVLTNEVPLRQDEEWTSALGAFQRCAGFSRSRPRSTTDAVWLSVLTQVQIALEDISSQTCMSQFLHQNDARLALSALQTKVKTAFDALSVQISLALRMIND